MWISRARFRVLRNDSDRGRQLQGLLAMEQEAHRLTRHALALSQEQAKALDDRLETSRNYILRLEADLAKAMKGSWRWTDGKGDTNAAS